MKAPELLMAAAALALPIPAQQTASNHSTLASRGYVDAKLCYGCHPAIYTAYAHTGMGRSFGKLAPATVVEDFQRENRFYHAASGVWFEMFTRGGEYFERRYQIGYNGAQTNSNETRIDYFLGSANHARSYLHQTSDGRLVQLPVSWYSENGGTWAMSPGYDTRDQWYEQRGVTYDCMFCHNSYPSLPAAYRRRGDPQVFPAELSAGIDCQRCHGPGAAHIRAAQSSAPRLEDTRASILNPARLAARQQLEICMQCHLETSSQPLPESIVRFDRAPFSYSPGEPLGAYRIFFERAPNPGRDEPFEIAHSAYRLLQSRCFAGSQGSLTCTTCHDAHHASSERNAASKFSAACLGCHAETVGRLVGNGTHPADSNCTSCHMPKRRTADVVHVVMTDHLIQRRPPPGDLLAPRSERDSPESGPFKGEVELYYPNPLPPSAENELYLALAQVRDRSNLAAGISRLTRAIESAKPAFPEPYLELAEAWSAQNQPARAVEWYREALRRDPRYLAVLEGLGSALEKMDRKREAVDLLRRAVETAPRDARAWNTLGAVEFRLGERKEAAADYRRAIALDAELPEPRNGLGLVLAGNGDRAEAAAQFREAIRLLPNYGNAHWNLADLLAADGDFSQAAWEFRLTSELLPDNQAVAYNYAVTLNRLGQLSDAEVQVRRAIQLDDKFAQAHALLGHLLTDRNDAEGARLEYETALEIRPDLAAAQLDLGALLAARGEKAEAARWLRKVAAGPDAELRARARELLGKLGIQ